MIETFVEVKLKDDGSFLKVRETLSRIGIPQHHNIDGDKPILWQSCHILHKRGKFYIVHFKELFALDEHIRKEKGWASKGRETDFTDEDRARRNTIAKLLESWGLVEIINADMVEDQQTSLYKTLKVIPYKEKDKWLLKPKYAIGRKKHDRTNDK